MLPRRQAIDLEVDESQAVTMPLLPGQFSLHHTLAIHGSLPNLSDDRRIGVGISYIPARVRFVGQHRLTGMVVRGENRYGHFDPERPPAHDAGPEEVAYHSAVLRNYFESKKGLRIGNAE
jgi:hypothetical protein